MNCPRCGAPLNPNAAFCGNCGNRLEPGMAGGMSAGGMMGGMPPGGQQGYGVGAPNEPVPQVGEPRGILRSGDVAVRIEGELVPVVDVALGGRENIYFEHHVLLWKEPRVNIGLKPLKGAVKRIFAGLQIFVTQAAGPGNISFSRDAPGQIVALQMQPGEEIHVREHQFLLATDGVAYDFFRVRGISNILFGGTGFFIDRFVNQGGAGLLLLHGYGNVFTKTLAPGEAIDVEPGAFLWKDASVGMDTNLTNLSTGFFGGTSFTLNRFVGPGRLGIQSMTYHPPINANEGQRATGINLGGLLNT
ncbi:MAG TPA: AIM24 family protein [Chloroflexota bacterium]|nr:AIM24 family protein [Chloroflexota bacterium]